MGLGLGVRLGLVDKMDRYYMYIYICICMRERRMRSRMCIYEQTNNLRESAAGARACI